jgi:hypothetical protein
MCIQNLYKFIYCICIKWEFETQMFSYSYFESENCKSEMLRTICIYIFFVFGKQIQFYLYSVNTLKFILGIWWKCETQIYWYSNSLKLWNIICSTFNYFSNTGRQKIDLILFPAWTYKNDKYSFLNSSISFLSPLPVYHKEIRFAPAWIPMNQNIRIHWNSEMKKVLSYKDW